MIQDSINGCENSTVEFKTENVHNDSIAKEITALANFNGGDLFIGVEDDGTITGIKDKSLEQRIIQICRNNIMPSIIPDIRLVELDDKLILHVNIPKGINRPYRVKSTGKFYIRAGSSSIEPSNEELARLFQNGEMLHYELKPVYGAKPYNLNRSYLNVYLREYRQIQDIADSEEEFFQLLVNLNILTIINGEYIPSIGGLILFGNQPERFLPQSGIRAASFSGNDETADIIELKEFNGPAADVLEGALRFVYRNSSTLVSFADPIKRTDQDQYPPSIVRELLANAVAHRDYAITGAVIRLLVFQHRIEIRSPGTLPNTMTIARMNLGVCFHRNPIIMETLKDYGYVERIGRGILRSNRKLKQMNRKPLEFSDLGIELRTVLFDD